MIALKIAFNLFWTQTKRRSNLLLLLTLFSLAFYLSLISLTSSSVQQYLYGNLRHLLGADAVLISATPLADNDVATLQKHSRHMAQVQQVKLTLTNHALWKPVEIKAVGKHYPLQGDILVADNLSLQGTPRNNGPNRDEIWLDSQTLNALNLQVEDTLTVGNLPLTVAGVLLEEPDQLIENHQIALRGMMSLETLRRLDFSGSTRYRYLLEATDEQQLALARWVKKQPEWQLIAQILGNHPMSGLWKRIENFSGLTSVLLFVLGAITLDLIGQRLAIQQQHYLAICLANGLTRWQSIVVSFYIIVLTCVSALLPALLLSILTESSIVIALREFLPDISSDWQWSALVDVSVLCFGLFFFSQLPSFISLQKTEIRDLLRDIPVTHSSLLARVLFPVASMILIIGYYTDEWLLTAIFLIAIGMCLLFMLIITWLTFYLGERFTRGRVGTFALALYMMRKRITVKAGQIIGIGLSLTLLLISTRTTEDLTYMVEAAMQTNDGNLIIREINHEQKSILDQWANDNRATVRAMYPFRIAMLTHVNGHPFNDGQRRASDSYTMVREGIRLTWASELPQNTKVLEGSWEKLSAEEAYTISHTDTKNSLKIDSMIYPVSIEEEIAENLDMSVGDRLIFLVGKHRLLVKITSIHGINGGGSVLRLPFILGHEKPPVISEKPLYMGSMQLEGALWDKMSEVWRQHPSMLLESFEEIKQRVDRFGYSALAIILSFNLFIALMSGLLVTAAIQGFEKDDRKRNGLILSFGLSQKHCLKLVAYEWLLTAAIAATGAILSTVVGASIIYQQQFGSTYEPSWLWLLFSSVSTVLGIAGAGLWMCREHLKVSVVGLLNDSEQSTY